MLTTSSKASGTCMFLKLFVPTPKKHIGNMPNVYSIHFRWSPFKRLFPCADATSYLARALCVSPCAHVTKYQIPNICVWVVRCVLCTNKKIIDKNFSSIEIYWLCMNKLNAKVECVRCTVCCVRKKIICTYVCMHTYFVKWNGAVLSVWVCMNVLCWGRTFINNTTE